jgi:Flp pilus assembly protein TadG
MKEQKRRGNQRGATLVEVPFALLWVFTALFGMTESARVMLAYTTLCEAARAGTRYAIVHGSYRTGGCTRDTLDGKAGPADDPLCVVRIVEDAVSAAGLSTASDRLTVQVRYPDSTNNIGHPVKVTVSYSFSSILPLLAPFSVPIGSTSEGMICY